MFEPYVQSARSQMAETALVGLIRVRIGQNDGTGAKEMIRRYENLFPQGDRVAEVERLKSILLAP
jgi:hypothetical protein